MKYITTINGILLRDTYNSRISFLSHHENFGILFGTDDSCLYKHGHYQSVVLAYERMVRQFRKVNMQDAINNLTIVKIPVVEIMQNPELLHDINRCLNNSNYLINFIQTIRNMADSWL